jgi:endonuclease YncB( thermonuclease family)
MLSLAATLGMPASEALAQAVIEGRVVAIHDGDTITVLVGSNQVKLRLAGIDTPERGQPWADRARQALAARVFRKQVRINQVDTDRYGRMVGEVYADNVCVGCELVREGHAWVYRKYSDDPVLLALEAEAREAQRGLWGLPETERVPPWEWRRGAGRAPAVALQLQEVAPESFACGVKRRCREMTSCAEARFHLTECGLSQLDGDADGVPCEAICEAWCPGGPPCLEK